MAHGRDDRGRAAGYPRVVSFDPSPKASGKAPWRAWARARRARIGRPAWSRAVVEGLRAWPRYREADTVLIYLALAEEPMLEALLPDSKRWVAPRMRERPLGLSLHVVDLERVVTGRFGVREPGIGAPPVAPDAVDLALLPGLAFDREGVRLGYGRGYYDRLLPDLAPGTPRVGITHTSLIADRLPHEAHDVSVTHLAHERGVEAIG